MAYYKSNFLAGDERAKSIQKYFEKIHDINLSDAQLYDLAIMGNAFLRPILRGTDYYQRLKRLYELEKERQRTGKPISKRIIAMKIFSLQQDYADRAGVFGRTPIIAVGKRDDVSEIIKSIEDEETEEEI